MRHRIVANCTCCMSFVNRVDYGVVPLNINMFTLLKFMVQESGYRLSLVCFIENTYLKTLLV